MSRVIATVDGKVPELFTPGEVERLLGVSRTTVKRWARDGRIESVMTPGGHRRYPSAQPAFAAVLAYRARQDGGRS